MYECIYSCIDTCQHVDDILCIQGHVNIYPLNEFKTTPPYKHIIYISC